MATVWIHRVDASDILVDFNSTFDAYEFVLKVVRNNENVEYDIQISMDEVINNPLNINTLTVATTATLQLLIIPFGGVPHPAWSDAGFVNVSAEEALALGNDDDPEGFVPYESETVWRKETRTVAELDAELDNYMADWRDITAAAQVSFHALKIS